MDRLRRPGPERYLSTGELLTEEDLRDLSRSFRAIYFGPSRDARVKPAFSRKASCLRSGSTSTSSSTSGRTQNSSRALRRRSQTKDGRMSISWWSGRTPRLLRRDRFQVFREARWRRRSRLVRDLYNIRFGLDVETDADEIALPDRASSRGRRAERGDPCTPSTWP